MAKSYPHHPLADEYPLLGGPEFEAMVASVREHGQILPVVLWRGQVIDGRNRQRACAAAGADCRYEEWMGTEDRLEAHIEALNEHRRMMTAAQLEKKRELRLRRVADARKGGKSLRAIAADEGVSQEQVRRDLKQESTVTGVTVEPEGGKVKGRDGKSRTAKPKKKAEPKPKKQAKTEEVADALGIVVPHYLRDAFADRTLAEQADRVRGWREAVEYASVSRRLQAAGPYFPHLSLGKVGEFLEEAHQLLTAAEEVIKNGIPYALCPDCKGAPGGCDSCRKCGHVPQWRHEEMLEHARLEGRQP